LAEVAKNAKKDILREFKVIDFVTNRKSICDFLLVVNSNLGRISHGFRVTETYWSKNSPWGNTHCISYLTPSLARRGTLYRQN